MSDYVFDSDATLRAKGKAAIDREDYATLDEIGREMTDRGTGRTSRRQANALLAAGWTFELPASPDPEVMSWYWRRPPRRLGRKGRMYLSTTQAFNALMKDQSCSSADRSS